MEIREINNKKIWEDFWRGQQEKSFLQSWNWGEFQKLQGHKIWRLGTFNNGKLISVVLASKISAKRGTFLLIQHNLEISEELLRELKKIAKEEKCDFIRIAPLLERNNKNIIIFKNFRFRKAPMHANAYEATWKLNIEKPEEELLKNMRKTTRYLIRQAEKNPEISIEKTDSLENLEVYQKLNREVAKRQRFIPFSEQFIKNEFEVFAKDDQALFLFGKFKGEVVAGALIIFWSGIAFYHQAASLGKYNKLSIPYLVLWEAIKEAKKRGCSLFDFWGYVDPFTEKKHPWAGPTLFKMGFGGYKKEYIQTQDYPLSLNYLLIFIFEILRKIKRGL